MAETEPPDPYPVIPDGINEKSPSFDKDMLESHYFANGSAPPEVQGAFNPSFFWTLTFYALIPTLVFFGLIGNFIGIRVVLYKFSGELGFRFQALMMMIDSVSLVLILCQVMGYYWGLGNAVVSRLHQQFTAYWFEQSYVLRFCLTFVIDPLRHLFVAAGPILLLGVGLDRVISLARPIYYKTVMNRERWLGLVFVGSLLLSSPTGVSFVFMNGIKGVQINSTSNGVVMVYKRYMKADYVVSSLSTGLRLFGSFVKVGTFLGLLFVTLAVVLLYRKQIKASKQKFGNNSMLSRASKPSQTSQSKGGAPSSLASHSQPSQNRSASQRPTLVAPEVLAKLMLAQVCLVAFGSLPEGLGLISLTFRYDLLGLGKSRLTLRELGYASMASLNVFVYSLVSSRFKMAVREIVSCKQAKEEVVMSSSTNKNPRNEEKY